MEGYLAQVIMFAGTFAPRNWAYCQGQLLPISSNSALFSLIGTTYGGDGRSTFALPDLRSRVPVGVGQGPGLSRYVLGERFGSPTNTLTTANLPSHNHTATLRAETAQGDSRNPNNKLLAFVNGTAEPYATPVPADEINMASESIVVGNTGSNSPVNNVQPGLGMNYIICTQGIFPSRN